MTPDSRHILISISAQRLYLFELPDGQDPEARWTEEGLQSAKLLLSTSISSSAKGTGQLKGSFQTPLGRHRIRARIGAGAALNTVFVGRRPTGELWSEELAAQSQRKDWILTRILWLSGLEPGLNRFGEVDTMRRYVYLHGSPATAEMGAPGSIGCIRMRNQDIVELFDLVSHKTTVHLQA